MNRAKVNPYLLFWLAFWLNFVAQAAHEIGHLAVYQGYGLAPTWGFTRLVQTDVLPQHPEAWTATTSLDGTPKWLRLSSLGSAREEAIAAASGPLASLLAAILGLALAFRARQPSWQTIGLVLALTMAFSMGAYYLRSPMRTGGDEAEVAAFLGITKAALEIPLGLAFGVCLALGLRRLSTWRSRLAWLGLIVLASLVGGILLMQLDAVLTIQVDRGNLLFQAVLGYSLPVLLLNVLACLVVWFTGIKLNIQTRDT